MCIRFEKDLSFLPGMFIPADSKRNEKSYKLSIYAVKVRKKAFNRAFTELISRLDKINADPEYRKKAIDVLCSPFGMFAETNRLYWAEFANVIDDEIIDMQVSGVLDEIDKRFSGNLAV